MPEHAAKKQINVMYTSVLLRWPILASIDVRYSVKNRAVSSVQCSVTFDFPSLLATCIWSGLNVGSLDKYSFQ